MSVYSRECVSHIPAVVQLPHIGIMEEKRKRVMDAIRHRQTDMVPWNFELTPGAAENIKAFTGCRDAFQYLDNHMLREKYKKNIKLASGEEKDLFGVTWKPSKDAEGTWESFQTIP